MPYDFYITDDEYAEAKKNGISYDTLNTRVRSLGWSKRRAIKTPVKKRASYKDHRNYSKIAIENNIPLSTYYSRVERGMSKEEASTKPTPCKIEWSARMRKRIKRKHPEWVYENLEKHNIGYPTFLYRIRKGWSLKDASTRKPMSKSEAAKRRNRDVHTVR